MRILAIALSPTESRQEILAEACLRFSPLVSIGANAVFVEIGRCHLLYSEDSIRARAQVLIRRLGISARIAIADDLATALSLAISQVTTREKIPVDYLPHYLSPYETTDLLDDMIQSLKRLGIHELGAFLALPRRSIASRFGKLGLFCRENCDYPERIPLRPFQPRTQIEETETIDETYALTSLEPLLFCLKKILDRISLRLRGAGRLALRMKLTLSLTPHSHVQTPHPVFDFTFPFPQGSTNSLIPLFRDRLDAIFQRHPLESAVQKIRIEVLETVPSQGAQKNFFHRREEELESYRGIVARLTDRLGFSRVFHAETVESYIPERGWKKTLSPPNAHPTPLPERPLRILRTPIPIHPIDDYFQTKHRKWRVIEMRGPERIRGEWWMNEREERDYYRIVTDSGEDLWIFENRETGNTYLQGVFD